MKPKKGDIVRLDSTPEPRYNKDGKVIGYVPRNSPFTEFFRWKGTETEQHIFGGLVVEVLRGNP